MVYCVHTFELDMTANHSDQPVCVDSIDGTFRAEV